MNCIVCGKVKGGNGIDFMCSNKCRKKRRKQIKSLKISYKGAE
jgi:hypothetical protein